MQSVFSTGNRIVDESAALNITGNVIPHIWYKTMVKESGKPYLTAIVILADIVYWYKPTEVRDESTGQVIAFKKKFSADLLQRNYQQISEEFGISKKEATNAIIFLEKLGVIKRVFRTLNINGLVLNNVLFLELVIEKLREITYPETGVPQKRETLPPEKGIGVSQKSDTYPPKKSIPIPCMGQTNTEIITENTTNESYPIKLYTEMERFFKEQIDYDAICNDRIYDQGQVDEIVMIAIDVLLSKAQTVRINREDKPTQIVQSMYHKLNKFSVEYVLDSLRQCETKANNIRAFILTALYNAPMTIENYYTNRVNCHEPAAGP